MRVPEHRGGAGAGRRADKLPRRHAVERPRRVLDAVPAQLAFPVRQLALVLDEEAGLANKLAGLFG